MTSPSLITQPLPKLSAREQSAFQRTGVPILLFVITMFSTTAVGMRYMHNFRLGLPPLASDADVLPYGWVFENLKDLASGLPFSLTLVGILLAHEFGHYFACRSFGVRSSLPYLLPAPSLSGTFGAVIRIKSRVNSRAALIGIGAAGPIAGFMVAIVAVLIGILHSSYAPLPVVHVQAPLLISLLHSIVRHNVPLPRAGLAALALAHIIPHPILVASWIGLLITALNLLPAGQLDGGHILYALSPRAHKVSSRLVTLMLFLLGLFCWAGWLLWAAILLFPGMRHPRVTDARALRPRHFALAGICACILLLAVTYQPFRGYGLIEIFRSLPTRYR